MPRFLDCAYTLLVEACQGATHDLLGALEKSAAWSSEPEAKTVEDAVVAQNQASMAAFQSMMAGVRK